MAGVIKEEKYRHWHKYLSTKQYFNNPNAVRRTGLYELARNWRIGSELASSRPFVLVNLGFEENFRKQANLLEAFEGTLAKRRGAKFLRVAWPDFIERIPKPMPQWFERFITSRRLIG